ncbi:MAG: hypothetical protein IT536_16650 [Hyphomicrobiales bacterium]|nr:hypothetical protein [Hyphomicrobiales bacterium]
MTDPDRDRSISRMTWIAFILAAIVGLLSIVLVRPGPAQEWTPVEQGRSL